MHFIRELNHLSDLIDFAFIISTFKWFIFYLTMKKFLEKLSEFLKEITQKLSDFLKEITQKFSELLNTEKPVVEEKPE